MFNIPLPPMMIKMVLDKLDEGYDPSQVTAGVAELCQQYPDRIPTIRRLLGDVLAALPAPATVPAEGQHTDPPQLAVVK